MTTFLHLIAYSVSNTNMRVLFLLGQIKPVEHGYVFLMAVGYGKPFGNLFPIF